MTRISLQHIKIPRDSFGVRAALRQLSQGEDSVSQSSFDQDRNGRLDLNGTTRQWSAPLFRRVEEVLIEGGFLRHRQRSIPNATFQASFQAEELQVPCSNGSGSQGSVEWIGDVHEQPGLGDGQEYNAVVRQRHAVLRRLVQQQPRATDLFLESLTQDVSAAEFHRNPDFADYIQRARALFRGPDGQIQIPDQLSPAQVELLSEPVLPNYPGTAALVYAALFEDVNLHATIDPEVNENFRQTFMADRYLAQYCTAQEVRQEVQQRWIDGNRRREDQAVARIHAFMSEHPQAHCTLIFGVNHRRFIDLLSEQYDLTSVYFPGVERLLNPLIESDRQSRAEFNFREAIQREVARVLEAASIQVLSSLQLRLTLPEQGPLRPEHIRDIRVELVAVRSLGSRSRRQVERLIIQTVRNYLLRSQVMAKFNLRQFSSRYRFSDAEGQMELLFGTALETPMHSENPEVCQENARAMDERQDR